MSFTLQPLKKPRGNPNWVKKTGQTVLPPHMPGLQDPGPRLKNLVQQHGIASIMKAMNDVDYLAETFSTYDGMLIIGLANSLAGSGEERERMLNRMFGKVPDKQINLNLNIEVTPDQLNTRADELLAKLAADDADLIG